MNSLAITTQTFVEELIRGEAAKAALLSGRPDLCKVAGDRAVAAHRTRREAPS